MTRFSDEHVDLIAARSRALGDATRVRILTVLARGEQAVGQIAGAPIDFIHRFDVSPASLTAVGLHDDGATLLYVNERT